MITETWIHLKCTSLTLDDYHNLTIDTTPWTCHICLNSIFPFNSLDNDDFYLTFSDMSNDSQTDSYSLNDDSNSSTSSSSFSPQDFDSNSEHDFVDPNIPFNSFNNSQYYSTEQFQKTHNIDGFSLLHLNIRSLSKNFDKFKCLLDSINYRFSIIAISETWLTSSPHSYYYLPGYKLIVNNRQGRTGGGVALYIDCELNFKIRDDLKCSDDALESLFVEISIPKTKDIIAGVMYKPPSVSHNEFMPIFQNLLIQMISDKKVCCISGDFNINLLDNNPSSQALMDITTSFSFLPTINKPTRISNTSATLIDNVFTNILPSPRSGILLTDISDHLPIFMIMPSCKFDVSSNNHIISTHSRNLTRDNIQRLNADLHSTDWTSVCTCNNPDQALNNFVDHFIFKYDKHIPLISHKHQVHSKSNPNAPWITKSLLKSINKKHKLYRRYLAHPSNSRKIKYTITIFLPVYCVPLKNSIIFTSLIRKRTIYVIHGRLLIRC